MEHKSPRNGGFFCISYLLFENGGPNGIELGKVMKTVEEKHRFIELWVKGRSLESIAEEMAYQSKP
jgi:hypothetical protein